MIESIVEWHEMSKEKPNQAGLFLACRKMSTSSNRTECLNWTGSMWCFDGKGNSGSGTSQDVIYLAEFSLPPQNNE